jgi:hypothetical protein
MRTKVPNGFQKLLVPSQMEAIRWQVYVTAALAAAHLEQLVKQLVRVYVPAEVLYCCISEGRHAEQQTTVASVTCL